MKPNSYQLKPEIRRKIVLSCFAVLASLLCWRAMDLQLTNREFLQDHGDARYLRTVKNPAHRGMITDRNGEPLAISTPVQSVWGQPRVMAENRAQWVQLAALIDTTTDHLEALILPRTNREFVYLKRHIEPQVAAELKAAKIEGVGLLEEQRRYYPAAEVTAHTLGFTNVDDAGQEGIELAFDETLKGTAGSRRVIKDLYGRVIEHVEQIKPTQAGRNLTLSLDKRIQYIAYRELKAAVQAHNAEAGSLVIVNPNTGEILALVNQPSFNPNNRGELKGSNYRNRAVTDVFEPGSTMKPITIAAALESGKYQPTTAINTAPGSFKVGRHVVSDAGDFGMLDVAGVIAKSSNVGASKIALSLEAEYLWQTFSAVGFGRTSGAGLPGETSGRLNDPRNWGDIERATVAFGYGLSVNALQLSRAYAAIAADGVLRPLSITRVGHAVLGQRVISAKTARELRTMLTRVTTEGTGQAAKLVGYSVAGKTGTVHKSTARGYAEDRYLSLFAGMLPADQPELVGVVVIDEPQSGEHFGGRVAAPIFSRVMAEAVRVLGLSPQAPDDIDENRYRVVAEVGQALDPASHP